MPTVGSALLHALPPSTSIFLVSVISRRGVLIDYSLSSEWLLPTTVSTSCSCRPSFTTSLCAIKLASAVDSATVDCCILRHEIIAFPPRIRDCEYFTSSPLSPCYVFSVFRKTCCIINIHQQSQISSNVNIQTWSHCRRWNFLTFHDFVQCLIPDSRSLLRPYSNFMSLQTVWLSPLFSPNSRFSIKTSASIFPFNDAVFTSIWFTSKFSNLLGPWSVLLEDSPPLGQISHHIQSQ